MKPVEHLENFRGEYCDADKCGKCVFEETDTGACYLKSMIRHLGGDPDGAMVNKPEFNQEAAYKNFMSLMGGICKELHVMNNHLSTIEKRR